MTAQLEGLDYWIEELNNSSEINEKLSFVLLGNKADLAESENTTCDDLIREWCKKQLLDYDIKVEYFKTSAKTGEGIKDAFKYLSKTIIDKSTKANPNEFGMKHAGHMSPLFENEEGIGSPTLTRGSFDSRLMTSPTIPLRRDQYRGKKKCAC